jgi:hypothetical protein
MMFKFMLDLLQAFEWSCRSYVNVASIFAGGESPYMEYVNFCNTFTLKNFGLELIVINIRRSGFHQCKEAPF